MELLVQHGAKLDAVDATRQTRSPKAAFFAQPSLLANLLERPEMAARSSLDCRDRHEGTAADAGQHGEGRPGVTNRQVLQALLDHPAVRDARIIDESDACQQLPAARGLQERLFADFSKSTFRWPSTEDEDFEHADAHAALAGQARICQLLIEEGKAESPETLLRENDSPTDPARQVERHAAVLACQGGHSMRIFATPAGPERYAASQADIRKMRPLLRRVFDQMRGDQPRRAAAGPGGTGTTIAVAFNYAAFLSDDSYIRWSGTRGRRWRRLPAASRTISGPRKAPLIISRECQRQRHLRLVRAGLKDSANVAATVGGAVRDSLKNHR
uniref:ANK_REP_REGION domain-containing protein n=1 Tax=Macrostomum lignano TaxID=282301 RepID=A0A1I8F3V5_9PLAT